MFINLYMMYVILISNKYILNHTSIIDVPY